MKSTKLGVLVRLVALLVVLGLLQFADACPTCKESLADGNNQNLVRGFGWSVLFMMSVPFLIVAGLTSYFYYEVRKARRAAGVGATSVAHGGLRGKMGEPLVGVSLTSD